jgi:hypothetical protein
MQPTRPSGSSEASESMFGEVDMYGPPAVGLKQRFAQQDEATRRPDDIGKDPGIWRRLFGRK